MNSRRPARESRDGAASSRSPKGTGGSRAPQSSSGSSQGSRSGAGKSGTSGGRGKSFGPKRSGGKRPGAKSSASQSSGAQSSGRASGGGKFGKPGDGRARNAAADKRVAGPGPIHAPGSSVADAVSDGDGLVRLNKYLASHGIGSRRKSDEMIQEGAVMIDDAIVTDLGLKIDPRVHKIEVDGVVLKPEGLRYRYYLLNKPSGVVCTNDERESKPRAIDLIADRKKGRIYTVGRLDEDTVGLVILTNDGDFAHRIMHPRYGVPKTYLVKLMGRIDEASVQKIREGVHLSEGRMAGARVLVQQRSPKVSRLRVTLHEGKNREVRRVFARLGYKVLDLKRVRIGSLDDRGLKTGHWRPLTRGEVRELLEIAESDGRYEPEERGRAQAGRGGDSGRSNGGGRGAGARGGGGRGGRGRSTGGRGR